MALDFRASLCKLIHAKKLGPLIIFLYCIITHYFTKINVETTLTF